MFGTRACEQPNLVLLFLLVSDLDMTTCCPHRDLSRHILSEKKDHHLGSNSETNLHVKITKIAFGGTTKILGNSSFRLLKGLSH
jgi:hypothetical protein